MRRVITLGVLALAAGCRTPPEPAAPPEIVLSAPPVASEPARMPEPPRPPCPPRQPIGIVSVSPNRRVIVTACSGVCDAGRERYPIDVWDIARGTVARRLDMELPKVVRIAWGPGGLLAAVADPSTGMGEGRVWDWSTWAPVGASDVYCFQSLAFDPAGKHLLLAGCNGTLTAVDTATGKLVHRPEKEAHVAGDYGIEVRYSDDGQKVLVADEYAGVQLLRAATLVGQAEASPGHLVCQAFAPKKDRLVVVDSGGTLQLYDAARPRKLAKLARDESHACAAIAWIDAGRFAVARDDGTLAVWDAERGRLVRSLRAQGSPVTALAADPQGALLASVDQDEIVIWDIATGARHQEIRRPPPPDAGGSFDMTSRPTPVWSPSGKHVAALADGQAVTWTRETGAVSRLPLAGDPQVARSLAWSPDDTVLAFTDGDAHLLRVADRGVLTLSVFERDGRREGLVTAWDGRFAGPDDLARCAPSTPPPGERRAALLADFFAGR
jgi:WD40 repeat protein